MKRRAVLWPLAAPTFPAGRRRPATCSGARRAGKTALSCESADGLLLRYQRHSAHTLVALGNVLPVEDVPDGVEEFRLLIQILQIPSMFPRVQYQQRQTALDRL